MEQFTEILTIIVVVLFIGSLICMFPYFAHKEAKIKKQRESFEILFKASVTEDGTPVDEVFDNLSKEDVDIGYLKKVDGRLL